MDESIVERSKDVCNAEHEFTFTNLRSESDSFLGSGGLLGGSLRLVDID
jgi:hypothetical protein